ncbi:hypothetical protein CcCBS67573_g08408 [Chytriomyces confervae]|uniref:C2H2-type domain-containing protein n=1 Tax=Chytriomyces confervae TaxID=246404 RepID=A0A507EMI6_9FUNG|nr:hypothetical protein CcCBS67573_g08408 [Chytriomyces confervae]
MSSIGLSASGYASSMNRDTSNSSLFKTEFESSESMELDIEDFLLSELEAAVTPEVKYEPTSAPVQWSYDFPSLAGSGLFGVSERTLVNNEVSANIAAATSAANSGKIPSFNFNVDCDSSGDLVQFGFDFPAPQNQIFSSAPSPMPQTIPQNFLMDFSVPATTDPSGMVHQVVSPFKAGVFSVPVLNALATTPNLDAGLKEGDGQVDNLASAIERSRANSVTPAPPGMQVDSGLLNSVSNPGSTFRNISLASLPIEDCPLTKEQMDVLQRRRNAFTCDGASFKSLATAAVTPPAIPPTFFNSDSTMLGEEVIIRSDNYLLTSVPSSQCDNSAFIPRQRNTAKLEIVTNHKRQQHRSAPVFNSASTTSSGSGAASTSSPSSFTAGTPSSSQTPSPVTAKQKLSKASRLHAGGYTHVYKCPMAGCTQSFHKQMNLTSHIKTHKSNKIFTCPECGCGATFRRSHDLRRHYLSMHNETGKQFNCPSCPKKFARLDALKRHVSRIGNKCYKYLGEEGCMQRLTELIKDDMIHRGIPLDSLALHCAMLGSSSGSRSVVSTNGEPGPPLSRTEIVLNAIARKRGRKTDGGGNVGGLREVGNEMDSLAEALGLDVERKPGFLASN